MMYSPSASRPAIPVQLAARDTVHASERRAHHPVV